MKENITRHQLLGEMDVEYAWIYEHLRTLTYEKSPDYDWMTKTLHQLIKRNKFTENPMDWEMGGASFAQAKAVNAQPYAAMMPDKNNVIKGGPGDESDIHEDPL